jgi:hypothetical protein
MVVAAAVGQGQAARKEMSSGIKMQLERVRCYPLGSFGRQRYGVCTNLRAFIKEDEMPRGDKSKYTDKEKRQEQHIEEGYESRGVPDKEAERRAWATVNKVHGGGEKPGGGGYGEPENHEPMRKGGHKGGKNSHKK